MTTRNTLRLVLALACAAPLAACGGDAATDATADSAETAPETGNAVRPSPPLIALKQTGSVPGIDFSIESVEQRPRIGSSSFGRQTATGETFVVVRYALKNTSSEPMSSSERPEMRLEDREGRSYSDDRGAGLSLTEGGLADAVNDTNPNGTAKVAAVWKVDKASFDAGGWTLVLSTEPPLRFALK